MKKEVCRERRLAAFALTLDELDILWSRMLDLFENRDGIHASIEIHHAEEKIEFESVDELRGYSSISGRVLDFSLWISDGKSRIALRSSNLASPLAVVHATAESETWCAGAIETVSTFIASHRVWHHRLAAAQLNWIIMVLVGTGWALAAAVPGYSGPFRTAIPIDSGQTFRSIPDKDSGGFRTSRKPHLKGCRAG